MLMGQDHGLYVERNGVFVRREGVFHRSDEYDEDGFDILVRMQREHFWYCGRHRFLLHALKSHLSRVSLPVMKVSAVDLGAGCGGWVRYLTSHLPDRFRELAMADSSPRALELAAGTVDASVTRYQVDLLDLGWRDRWDVVFLLDVLEHIPDQASALRQISESLTPGGFLFLTVPALTCFWSSNDDMAKHLRRYSRRDLESLANLCDLKLVKARYFMFYLSPLLYFSRCFGPKIQNMSPEQIRERLHKTHKVPPKLINALLSGIFSMESPFGNWLPFPWGTSILGIYQKVPTGAA